MTRGTALRAFVFCLFQLVVVLVLLCIQRLSCLRMLVSSRLNLIPRRSWLLTFRWKQLPLKTTKGSPFVRKHEQPSPIEYSSGSESSPLRNSEPQYTNMSGTPGSSFPSPAAPAGTPPATSVTTTAQTQHSLTRTQFEPVTAHTAKCDLCNARNDLGMSRCSSCGWQSCHACTIKNGCTRTHNAGSRVHTGPIDRNELVSSSVLPKSKKKKGLPKRENANKVQKDLARRSQRGCGRGRGREQAQTPRTQSQTKRDQRQGVYRARSPSRTPEATVNSPVSLDDWQSTAPLLDDEAFTPSTATDVDEAEAEMDKVLAGARNLYAFSLEAHGEWIQEEREKEPARRWCYQAYKLSDLHGYAQDQAARAMEEFRKRDGWWGCF